MRRAAFFRLSFPLYGSRLLSILLLGLFAWSGNAQIYVAQTTQGNGTGTNAANAKSLAWLNSSTSWNNGAGTVVPGTTVHLVGTLTSSLQMQASGSAGKPITIYFEPNAMFSAPTWTSGNTAQAYGGYAAIDAPYLSYIVIDGGSNGIIQATANGTGLAYANNSFSAIELDGCNNATVQNLTIQNLYVNTPSDENGGNTGIFIGGGSQWGNLTISNCVFHDESTGAFFVYYPSCHDFNFVNNTAYHCNWGVGGGDASSSSWVNNVNIIGNHLYSWSNWDDPLDNNHHNGAYVWDNSTGAWVSNLVYAYNYVGPGYGVHNTSGLFESGNIDAFRAYNNVFDCTDGSAPADACLYVSGDSTVSAVTNWVLNNTFYRCPGTSILFYGWTVAKTYNYCLNNEVFNGVGGTAVVFGPYANNDFIQCNSNNFYACNPNSVMVGSSGTSYNFYSLAQWQSLGYDANSTTNNPLLNSQWQPTNGSPLLNAGGNFSGFFTNDYAYKPRPATGNWTIGAYQLAAGSALLPSISLAASPTNPAVGVSNPATSNSSTLMLTWSSANATNVILSGFGTVSMVGSTNTAPTQATNYTATAIGPGGTNSASVTVNVPLAPTSLKVSPL